MTRGRAAKVALDAAVLVKYLDSLSEYRVDGNPRRRRHFINGVCLPQDGGARIIRRWRTGIQGVTPHAADRLLRQVGKSTGDFIVWAADNGEEALLRGSVNQLRRL